MPLDPWPDDTDKSEWETHWGDPEHDLPRVPSTDTDEDDADPELVQTFWRSVLLANVAVFALALGPMLIYFRGQWSLGAAAIGLGAITGLRVYQHCRAFGSDEATDDDPADERNA
ncbi:DUF7322 domain-containing protein [Haloplanus halobius]|uniref:DUF7322 domain-containing protein n=1 Tax=Haloplanus halobius TaxID=2934938 RepID=UPI00200C4569|nr:hypothetical protein [Haloplanus sp. XH21]